MLLDLEKNNMPFFPPHPTYPMATFTSFGSRMSVYLLV
jgi:hypothetical protein